MAVDLTQLSEIEDPNESIACIGVDNLQHSCYHWSDVTLCNIPIKRKKVLRDDWKLFHCGNCDAHHW